MSCGGVGLHLLLHLAGLAVRGFRGGRVRPAHRGLAGQPQHANGLCAGCAGRGRLREGAESYAKALASDILR